MVCANRSAGAPVSNPPGFAELALRKRGYEQEVVFLEVLMAGLTLGFGRLGVDLFELPEDMPASVRISGPAIEATVNAPDALPSLAPVGLGDLGGQVNQVYIDAFERIILAGQDIEEVLDSQADTLRGLLAQAGAPCWAPDAASEGACPVN